MGKKDVSAIVRGAGLTASIILKLDRAVRERGGSEEQLHVLATDAGDALIGQIADLIVGRSVTAAASPLPSAPTAASPLPSAPPAALPLAEQPPPLPVVRDCLGDMIVIETETRSLAELLELGNYVDVDSHLTEENFPLAGGLPEIKVRLLSFDHKFTQAELDAKLDELGVRSATVQELAAFGAHHPSFLQDDPILATGSSWQSPEGDYAGVLWYQTQVEDRVDTPERPGQTGRRFNLIMMHRDAYQENVRVLTVC